MGNFVIFNQIDMLVNGYEGKILIMFVALIAVYFALSSKLWSIYVETKRATKSLKGEGEYFGILKALSNDFNLLSLNFSTYKENQMEDEYSPIDSYFDFYSILDRYSDRRMITTIPGILTAFGILFTFIGLYTSMSRIDLSSVDTTKGSIAFLMSGMSVAFVSSIIGIVLSIIWNILDKFFIRIVEKSILEFCDSFNSKFNVKFSNDYFHEMVIHQKEQTRYFQTFAEDISLKLGDTITKSITEVMKPSMEQIVMQNSNLVETINGTQVDGMDKIVNKIFDEVSNVMGNQMGNLSDAIEDMITWQKNTKEGLDGLVDQMIQMGDQQMNINAASEVVLEKYGQSVSNLSSIIDHFSSSLENIEKVSETISNQSAVLNDYKKQMDTLLSSSNQNISAIKNTVDEFSKTANTVETNLVAISGELNQSSLNFSENLNTGLMKSFSTFDDNLTQITGKLATVVKRSNESITDLPDILDDIKMNIEQFSMIIEEKLSDSEIS